MRVDERLHIARGVSKDVSTTVQLPGTGVPEPVWQVQRLLEQSLRRKVYVLHLSSLSIFLVTNIACNHVREVVAQTQSRTSFNCACADHYCILPENCLCSAH